jgi:hypothetical protein
MPALEALKTPRSLSNGKSSQRLLVKCSESDWIKIEQLHCVGPLTSRKKFYDAFIKLKNKARNPKQATSYGLPSSKNVATICNFHLWKYNNLEYMIQ